MLIEVLDLGFGKSMLVCVRSDFCMCAVRVCVCICVWGLPLLAIIYKS